MKKLIVLFFTLFTTIFSSDFQEFPIDEEKTRYKTPWGDEYIEHFENGKDIRIYEKYYSGDVIREETRDVDTKSLKIWQYGVMRNDDFYTDLTVIPELRKKGSGFNPFKKEQKTPEIEAYRIYYILDKKIVEKENGTYKYYPNENLAEEDLKYYEGEDKKEIYKRYDEAENIIYEAVKINSEEIKKFSSVDEYEKLKEKDLCEIFYPDGKKAYEKKLVLLSELNEKGTQEKYYNKEGVLLYESQIPLFEILDFSSKVLKRYDELYTAGNPFLQKIKKYRENGNILYEENFKIDGENIIFTKKSYFENGNIFYDEQEIINKKEYFRGLNREAENKSINSKYFLKRYDENKNLKYHGEWNGEKAIEKYYGEGNTLVKEVISE